MVMEVARTKQGPRVAGPMLTAMEYLTTATTDGQGTDLGVVQNHMEKIA